jgi:glycine/D-amino acid oxidase-like deaminating enzyme
MDETITRLITANPGLPQPNPTHAYWQHPPHALSTIQSSSLPGSTDIAIIGSGITGMSVAQTLLQQHPTVHVTVLEARTLCSGATGRNGGQLAANVGEEYSHLAAMLGSEMAGWIAQFTFENLRKMQQVIEVYGLADEVELQMLRKLRVFLTEETFEAFKESIAQLERDHEALRGFYTLVERDELKVGRPAFMVLALCIPG